MKTFRLGATGKPINGRVVRRTPQMPGVKEVPNRKYTWRVSNG